MKLNLTYKPDLKKAFAPSEQTCCLAIFENILLSISVSKPSKFSGIGKSPTNGNITPFSPSADTFIIVNPLPSKGSIEFIIVINVP